MSKKRKRILVFGYFGYVTNQLDGQTVKTRAIYELLRERAEADVRFADSQEFRHRPSSIFRFFRDLVRCNTLVWLPAHNNLKYLFLPIWLLSIVFRFNIIYVVVGGWLSTILKGLPLHRMLLRHISGILVENQHTIAELNQVYGFNNVEVLPNFRPACPAPGCDVVPNRLRLVFMARVNKMKGLDTIAEICGRLDGRNISIDFYGPINADDREYFFNEVVNRYECVEYKGAVEPKDINATLCGYYAMLLPTHYYTEGFPGSVLDAYQAGIPVIVTRWKHATEFVDEGRSGFIVDFEAPAAPMLERIEELRRNPDLLAKMKRAAYAESLKYTPDVAWKIIEKYL